jgi:hypothetical protein
MFRDRHFHRTGRWHARDDSFRLVSGPSVEDITETTAQVRWTMSAVCTGQVEFGTTTGYGNTTTEQGISGGFSQHVQTISGLSAGQTYHYRTKSTDAADVTVCSDDQTFTTSSATTVSYGPRAAPTLPSGAYTLPDTIDDTGAVDATSAINSFLSSLPAGSTVIFDQSGNSEGWVAGTDTPLSTYLISSPINVTKDLTIWGYGARLHNTNTGGGSYPGNIASVFLSGNSCTDVHILGLDIQGANPNAGTSSGHTSTERPMGIAMRDNIGTLEIADCYIWDTMGDGIYLGSWADWTIGPWWLHHNLINGTGRQGITINQHDSGTLLIEWNKLTGSALSLIDAEDKCPTSGVMDLNTTIIRNNEFGAWFTDATMAASYGAFCISWGFWWFDSNPLQNLGPVTISDNVWTADGVTVTAEAGDGLIALTGSTTNLNAMPTGIVHDFTITGNDASALPSDERSGRPAVVANTKMDGLTITDNVWTGMTLSYPRATNVSVSGNS